MKKNSKNIAFVLVLLILTLTVFLILAIPKLTEKNNPNTYSFTKAVCNEYNYCEDYEIKCENGNLAKFSPTGFAIQNSENWIDPRTKEDINKLC